MTNENRIFDKGDKVELIDGKKYIVLHTYGYRNQLWTALEDAEGRRMDYTVESLKTYLKEED